MIECTGHDFECASKNINGFLQIVLYQISMRISFAKCNLHLWSGRSAFWSTNLTCFHSIRYFSSVTIRVDNEWITLSSSRWTTYMIIKWNCQILISIFSGWIPFGRGRFRIQQIHTIKLGVQNEWTIASAALLAR